ncbi:hypothetical protein XabCFBP2524_06005 [Xanthomonas axonopodis pv. begoniae]|nr:hypothetical protein XabCFBP2524_06005 [Xanthomonas axonopodis pv. begoniae]
MHQLLRNAIRKESGDYVADISKFIWIGGLIYRWSDKTPEIVFSRGWSRKTGYDDIVRHTQVEQGKGSNWLSCSLDREATQSYGKYCYEIMLTHPHTKAIDANEAVKVLSKHLNPHAQQQEISVYRTIRPDEILACWIPIENPVMKHDPNIANYLFFEERYERMVNSARWK